MKLTTTPALPNILYPEDRPAHAPSTEPSKPGIVVGGEKGASLTAFSITSLPGPNLNKLQESFAPQSLSFRHSEVPAGKVIYAASQLISSITVCYILRLSLHNLSATSIHILMIHAISSKTIKYNQFLALIPGSLHQSFTGEDGALMLVLWSGCHAHVKPEDCTELTGPGSDLLKPGAGWANV